MKREHFLLLISLFLLPLSLLAENNPRSEINFNREWKYKRGDYPKAESKNYDDSKWENIGLPHSFSIPYFMSRDFYTGYGWYRKQFYLSEQDLSKVLSLEFDGVFQEAEIFINGEKVGTHRGGYTGFSVDITKSAKKGENIVAVRVNNLWQATLAPRGGEHVFSGGIYRNVRLIKKDNTHISWAGITVTTTELESSNGEATTVHIKSEICNKDKSDTNFRLISKVIDKSGKVISKVESNIEVPSMTTLAIYQATPSVKSPLLWSPDSPVLYSMVSELYKGGKLIDKEVTKFGFRWIKWSADKGFFLNGKHLFFHGANVHQDQAGWGDAVTDEASRRDVRMIKEAGFNMIRGSHYPHSPAFVEACDEEGVLFWSEAPFWGTAGDKSDGYWTSSAYPNRKEDCEEFEKSALDQLGEMIKIHRNSPSIIVWSMCNEPFFTSPNTMDGVKSLLKKMVNRTHELDSTRLAAIGGSQRPLGKERIDLIGDVAGYNGDGSTIVDFQNPGIPNVVTEYGSTTSDRPGEYNPGWGDLNKDEGWKGRDWRSGQAIWCGFDHGSIFGPDMGKMGMVDYFRIPKRSWYWYRNEYRHIAPPQWPVDGVPYRLALHASKVKNIAADGTDDVQLTVVVLDSSGREITDSPDVTLKVISGPGEFPTGSSISFRKDDDIRIQDGKAAISFRSYYSGKTIVEATSKGLQSAKVSLSFIGAPLYNKGISQQVTDRPYIRYVRNKGEEAGHFGLNNPTFSTTSESGRSSGYACDGKAETFWQPVASDNNASWTLDMERWPVIDEIVIKFAQSGAYRYILEVSEDNKGWTKVKDLSDNKSLFDNQIVKVDLKEKYRFVRISFPYYDGYVIPKLSEVDVKGSLDK